MSRLANKNACLVLILLIGLPFHLQAQEPAPLAHWYLGVKGAVVFTESGRPASNGKMIGLELGARVSAKSAIELEVYHSRTEFDAGFGVEAERQSAAHYRADFVVVSDAAHNIMMEHNYHETAKTIHEWLNERGVK